jgi:hypothetical protein
MSATTTAQTTNNNNSTPVSVLADNLMRRILRINNPSNPVEVAEGLGRAYPLESAELDEEIQGLPIGPPAPALLPLAAPSMAGRELVQAQSNIQRDLDFLTGSSQLKEVQVELQSWGETIRTWLADGAAAAGQALDSSARDRVFSARRILMDYARVSRLVGALTPGLSIPYRRFARSLDEAAGILLVSLGEALAQIGFSGDRLLLQAPAAELNARADAAAAALRNLSGSVQDAFTPSAWPWGLEGYRKLLNALENAGHGDIRVLLTENGLRAFTDELVNRASSVTGDGLRALAATHVLALERVQRLIQVGTSIANDSPPLASFLSALELFVDAFRGGNAYRLIALGRPLLSSSGLYTFGGPDPGTQTLLDLVQWRSAVAQLNDSLFGTDLTSADAQAQFEADSCLYSLDLAIDLYAVGVNPQGQGRIEQRAAAYGLFMWELLSQSGTGIAGLLNSPALSTAPPTNPLLPQGTPQGTVFPTTQVPPAGLPTIALLEYQITLAIWALGLSPPQQIYAVPPPLTIPPNPPTSGDLSGSLSNSDRELIAHELEAMRNRHSGLLALVNAITPGNFDPRSSMVPVEQALTTALALVGGAAVRGLAVPPPVETTIVRGIATRPFTAPQVTRLQPTTGPAGGGTPVMISGSGLTNASTVEFGSAAATNVSVLTDAQITATSPAGTGQAGVQVTTPAGISTLGPPTQFSYTPQVTQLNPTGGPAAGGTLVTLSGSGFTGVNSVSFGANAVALADIMVVSDTELIVTSPSGNVGTVDVQVSSIAQPGIQFTYLPLSGVNSLSVSSGPRAGGTLVVINGTGFSNVSEVRFGTTGVTQYTVVSPTQIVAISPPRGPRGNAVVVVSVTTPAGTSAVTQSLTREFTYN